MNKVDARKLLLEKRKALTRKQVNIFQDLLLIQFQELDLPYFKVLHTYLPIYDHNEPDPIPLVDWLRFKDPGMQVAYPKIDLSDLSMRHYVETEDTVFVLNTFGIPEPENALEIDAKEIDAVLIPLVAFDNDGNRVGYGKGFYDRFLSTCPSHTIKIGISFFPPVDKIEDIHFFDKKLDLCITPDLVYAF